MEKFIVLKVCNQRHDYYIRVSNETFIGDFWIQLSKFGYFKLDGFYKFDFSNSESKRMFELCIESNAHYYSSFNDFAKNRKKVA